MQLKEKLQLHYIEMQHLSQKFLVVNIRYQLYMTIHLRRIQVNFIGIARDLQELEEFIV